MANGMTNSTYLCSALRIARDEVSLPSRKDRIQEPRNLAKTASEFEAHGTESRTHRDNVCLGCIRFELLCKTIAMNVGRCFWGVEVAKVGFVPQGLKQPLEGVEKLNGRGRQIHYKVVNTLPQLWCVHRSYSAGRCVFSSLPLRPCLLPAASTWCQLDGIIISLLDHRTYK